MALAAAVLYCRRLRIHGLGMKKNKANAGLLYMGVGVQLTSMTIAGFLLGFVVDEFFGTRPFVMLAFGFLGFIGGVMKVHAFLTRLD